MTDQLAKTPGPSIVYTASEAQAVYDRGFAAGRAAALKEVAERVEKLWRDKGWQSIEDSAAKAAVLALLSTEEGS